MTAKYINAKGLMFKTYTKLYSSTVIPVLHYATAVWGTKVYEKQELVHHRAMRTFLGVGKKTPIPGLYGETGWPKLKHHKSIEVIKYWLKLFNMDNNRLTKRTFNWDYRRALQGKKGWNGDVRKILTDNDQIDTFYGLGVESPRKVLVNLENTLAKTAERKLLDEINTMPKLRTYKKVKLDTDTEQYVKSNMNRVQRSLIAKLRTGTFPINIELGRHKRTPVHERTCPHCTDKVEDEIHFTLQCPLYMEERRQLLMTLEEKADVSVDDLTQEELFFLLLSLSKLSKPLANYLEMTLSTRISYIKEKENGAGRKS